jgi:hypothetical protein
LATDSEGQIRDRDISSQEIAQTVACSGDQAEVAVIEGTLSLTGRIGMKDAPHIEEEETGSEVRRGDGERTIIDAGKSGLEERAKVEFTECGQAGRVIEQGVFIVGQSGECASHAERARAHPQVEDPNEALSIGCRRD